MDSVTQAVLGAAIQGVGMSRYQGRKAYVYGALLATVPDLDVLVPHVNPIMAMTTHRSFSHSIFVLTALAVLIVWVVCRFKPKPERSYSMKRLLIVVWLVLVTHAILDCFTVYGTQLFWPLPLPPVSWSSVFIVDPMYTLPLLVATICGLVWGFRQWTATLSAIALALSSAYLAVGVVAKSLADEQAMIALHHAGIKVVRLKSIPMPLTNLLWRVIAEDNHGQRYEVITGLLDKRLPEWRLLDASLSLRQMIRHYPDYQRLQWFTNDWVGVSVADQKLVIADQRMSNDGEPFFQFMVARQETHGRWKMVSAQALSHHYPEHPMARLKQLYQRIFEAKPLPYADWHMPSMSH